MIKLPWTKNQYDFFMSQQRRNPVPIHKDGARQYWTYKGRIYWETEDLKPDEVKALLDQREERKRRQIDRALHAPSKPPQGRRPIPNEVKVQVWRRDEGRCVTCDTKENLEFDHIIPLSRGGSNTVRDVQLLCESCNRGKGGEII